MSGESTVKLPNAMSYDELLNEGKSPEQAKKIMAERVFGVNFPIDEKGNPIERGKGSKLQPTSQHVEALRVANDRALHKSGGGVSSDVISAAVAAGVQAGLSAAKEETL